MEGGCDLVLDVSVIKLYNARLLPSSGVEDQRLSS